MRMDIHRVASVLRRLRLLWPAYYTLFALDYVRWYSDNRRFRRERPELPAPPPALLFETTTTTRLRRFYDNGQLHAKRIYARVASLLPEGDITICEWGCGVGRLVRHMPTIDAGRRIDAYASDYNLRAIAWCRRNIPSVTFEHNDSLPPLPFDNDIFDWLYAQSVYTHLPLESQRRWLTETLRVVKPGGLVYFTVHGDAYKERLLPDERAQYEGHGIVIRGNIEAGRPWFTTYHSPDFIERNFLADQEIVYRELFSEPDPRPRQDVWVVRKPWS